MTDHTHTVTMSIDAINKLFSQAESLYIRRELMPAQEIIQKSLCLARQGAHVTEEIQSILLLGRILHTRGRFQGDSMLFSEALTFLERASELNDTIIPNGVKPDILLLTGELYRDKGDHHTALGYLEEALTIYRQLKQVKGIVLSLCALSQLHVKTNAFKKALQHARECMSYLNEENDAAGSALQAEVYSQLCQVFIKRQEYGKILDYSRKLLAISRETGDLEKELTALNNLAVAFGVNSDYKTAMQYLLEALEKSKAVRFRSNTAQCLINVGTIYAHLYNHDEALNRYRTVLEEYRTVLDPNTEVIVYNNVGNIYYMTDRTEEAKSYFEKALKLAQSIHYTPMVAHSLAQLSRVKAAQKDYQTALIDALNAQELMADMEDVSGKQINLINLGNIYFHLGDFSNAIMHASRGIVTAKRMNDDASEIRGYQLMAKVYREQKDYEKALNYWLIYSKAQEKFQKEQRSRQIIDLEIKYAIEEKQKEIEQLTRENEYQALLLKQSDQISRQNAQLLQVNEELRQFAYVASHDLKEPLRMIGSYTQLIRRRFSEHRDEVSDQYFDFVEEGVTRMNNLLDALLKYATIGKEEKEFHKVSLADVVDTAVINLRVSIEESSAEIECVKLPEVYSNQALLIQLLQNLLSNAIKFRKAGTHPRISIKAWEEEKRYVINVSDDGIGIEPEFRDRIFVIFQRLHTRARYQGTGIGLAICYKIMQRLGGDIWVESEPGKGASFFFSIPKGERALVNRS